MFVLTGWILLRNRRRRQTNRGVLAAGLALFLLSTAVSTSFSAVSLSMCGVTYANVLAQIFSTNIARLREGLITIGPHQPQGIEEYFKDVSQTTFVIKSTLYNVQTLVLDAVVVCHRLCLMDGSSLKAAIFPDISGVYCMAEVVRCSGPRFELVWSSR